MADGIREAIASGRFKPGDILPTILEWSRLLGVSIRVPEASVAALVREGLLVAQKGVGCIVNPRRKDVWLGRVLVVVPDGDHVYIHNVLVGRLRAKLAMAGYLFSQVTVLSRPDGRYDFRQLAHELRTRPDFTLLLEDRPAIARFLSKSGLPFGVFAPSSCTLPGCVANFREDHGGAVPAFVAHCRRAGVRSVLQVSTKSVHLFDAIPAQKRPAGLVFKCQAMLDWSRGRFNHQPGPYVMGRAGRRVLREDEAMLEQLWRHYTADWLLRGAYAYEIVRLAHAEKDVPVTLNLVGNLVGDIHFPTALCAELFWSTAEPYETIRDRVLRRSPR